MKFLYGSLCFLVGVLCNKALASSQSYENIEKFIKSIPDTDRSESFVAEGDLNGDNLKDFAIAVTVNPDGLERYNQLHILVQEKSGKFLRTISSEQSPIIGMGCCWLDGIEIKKGSIFVKNVAKDGCDIQATTHQFKLYKGAWRLIGLKRFNYQHCEEPQISIEEDFNILTGKEIISKQLDDRPKTYKHIEFAPQKILLKDFDFGHDFGIPST